MSTQHFDPDLAGILHFTEEDLAANRAGYITEAQISLRKRHLRNFVFILVVLLGITIGRVVLNPGATTDSNETIRMVIIFLSLFLMAIIAVGFQRWLNRFTYDPTIASVTGKVERCRDGVRIGEVRFVVKNYIRVRLNGNYALYYSAGLWGSNTILSAERIVTQPPNEGKID